MLSILIPTYNYNICNLVVDLHNQAKMTQVPFEIVVMEDGSDMLLVENQFIQNLSNCRYLVSEKNLGRSAIRNRLAEVAQYPYLLFLDCDAKVSNADFIQNYLNVCVGNSVVCIGGTAYDPEVNQPEYSLRLKYGREKEAKVNQKSFAAGPVNFATFNFLISKSVFEKVKFDESIKGYGHEDTLFGHQLHEAGYSFQFVNNPIIHAGLDRNEVYIQKIEQATENLLKLYHTGRYPFLKDESKLLSSYLKMKELKLDGVLALKYRWMKKWIVKQLFSNRPSLLLFDIYKLLYICNFARKI